MVNMSLKYLVIMYVPVYDVTEQPCRPLNAHKNKTEFEEKL